MSGTMRTGVNVGPSMATDCATTSRKPRHSARSWLAATGVLKSDVGLHEGAEGQFLPDEARL